MTPPPPSSRCRPEDPVASPLRGPANLQRRSQLAGEAAAAIAEVESALSVEADPTSAAFFDVDNTVMQGASIFHLARGLHRREFFTTRDILGAAWKQVYFRVVGVEDPEHVAEARASALSFIAGHTVSELESLGEEIFDERMAHRIWPGTRALAQLHLDQGQRVWLVTAAPIEIATIIARRLGLTGALGTVAEHVDGVYTGELVGEMLHGSAKAVAVQRARRPVRARPRAVLGVLRLLQRPADAERRRRPVRDQPGQPPARARPRPRLADPRLPDRPQGRPGRACSPPAVAGGGRGHGRGRAPRSAARSAEKAPHAVPLQAAS